MAGKPLLVLIVPADRDGAKSWELGKTFGALFFHGGDAALALLAQCEVIAARQADVTTIVPGFVPVADSREALMVLVETDALPAVARSAFEPAGDAKPAKRAAPTAHTPAEARAAEQDAAEDAAVDARNEGLTRLLRDLIAPNTATVKRRAAQVAAVVPAERVAGVLRALEAGQVPPAADVDAVAGVVAAVGTPRAQTALAAAARVRLTEHDIDGAWRGISGGCGSQLLSPPPSDDNSRVAIACGMGFVSPKAQHFLDFYVLERAEERKKARAANKEAAQAAQGAH